MTIYAGKRAYQISLGFLGLLAALFAVVLFTSIASYKQALRDAKDRIGMELAAIARSGAAGFSGRELAELTRAAPGESAEAYAARMRRLPERPVFQKLRSQLQDLIAANEQLGFTYNNVYLFTPDPFDSDRLRWAVMAHPRPFTGEAYPVQPAMRPVLAGETESAYTEVYLSPASEREWISGYAPVRDEQGDVVGLLEAAWDSKAVLADARDSAESTLYVSGALLLFSLLGAGVLAAYSTALGRSNQRLDDEVQERKRAEERLRFQALHDGLTALPNRANFLNHLDKRLQAGARGLAVLAVDIPRLRAIEESLGASRAESAVVQTAGRLEGLVGLKDLLARPDSHSFWLLLEESGTLEEAAHRTEAIVRALAEPLQLAEAQATFPQHGAPLTENLTVYDRALYLTAGVGLVYAEGGDGENAYRSAEGMLQDAQGAAREAARYGGVQWRLARTRMHEQTRERLLLESELRRALPAGEFEAFFQPVYTLAPSGGVDALHGFEALVRWRRDGQILSPAAFLDAAIEGGLIVDLGQEMIRQCFDTCREWERAGYRNFTISLNLAAEQLARDSFCEELQRIRQDSRCSAACIELEITESSAMGDPQTAAEIFEHFRAQGYRIALDDFGTGFSSLAYLRRFPLDRLKVDRSFILELEQDRGATEIVLAILRLARSLGLNVTAEGVETASQLDFLRSNACDCVQGYYFGKPEPLMEAVRRFASTARRAVDDPLS